MHDAALRCASGGRRRWPILCGDMAHLANGLAASDRWCLDNRHGAISDRSVSSHANGIAKSVVR